MPVLHVKEIQPDFVLLVAVRSWCTAPLSTHFPLGYRVVFKDVGQDMGQRYPKRTQLKYTKQRYRVRNWCEYEAGLRKRGDLTLWFSAEAVAAWRAPTGEKPGGQPVYSDLAIETGLTVRVVYVLALRQTEDFLQSISTLLDLGLRIPDHTTLSRRSKGLNVRVPVSPCRQTTDRFTS